MYKIKTSLFVKQNSVECAFSDAASWVILNPIELSIKNKIEKVGVPLKDWDIKIYRGILTGCNEAFIISEQRRNEILSWCRNESEKHRTDELIRPILRGRDIKRYSYEYANLYLIATFPSRHYDIEQYPAVKKHLLSFDRERLAEAGRFDLLDEVSLAQYCKGRLEQTGADIIVNGKKVIVGNVKKSRKKTGNKWFETQDQISYWDDFSKQKIVWGEISDRTKFALDSNGDFMPEATSFLLTGNNLEYLVCFLNSPLSEYLFSKIGTTTGVGTVRWKKFKLEQLCVPTYNVDFHFFQRHLKDYLKSKDEKNLTIINQRIYRICSLTTEEIKFIESH